MFRCFSAHSSIAFTVPTIIWLITTNFAWAQQHIRADDTLSTQVLTSDNVNFTISNGDEAGTNLFHSFEEFSIPLGGTATFEHPVSIVNIINRITGGNRSEINGVIKSGSDANLFLINPNGIIFGPQAFLDVGGSFIASTANSIQFADNTTFSSDTSSEESLLTVSVPSGLQFGEVTGEIVNLSRAQSGLGLQVKPNRTLALVGGNLFIGSRGNNRGDFGALTALEGRIELGSVGDSSLVKLMQLPSGWTIDYDDIQNFQDISLERARIYTLTNPFTASQQGNGTIRFQGRQIKIANNSFIEGFNTGSEPGEPIIFRASESIDLLNRVRLSTSTSSTGIAGDIVFETNRLNINDSVAVEVITAGFGIGGNINIVALESVELSDRSVITASSVASRSGQAGNINLHTENLTLLQESRIESNTLGENNAGNLDFDVGQLIIQEGGIISTSTTGQGNGGQLRIHADSIDLVGSDGLFTFTGGEGDAGTLTVEADELTLRAGARISAEASQRATGDAGSIILHVGQVLLQDKGNITATNVSSASQGIQFQALDTLIVSDGSRITASTQTGEAGSVLVNTNEAAANLVKLSGIDSRLTAEATGMDGNAGSVRVNTRQLIVEDGAEVTVSSPQGQAGNLDIFGNQIRLNKGQLTAEAGLDQGAEINLQGLELLLMSNGSQISAQAFENANGGNVIINAPEGFIIAIPDQNNDIIARAVEGRGGDINITIQNIFGLEVRSAGDNISNDIDASSEAGIDGEVTINFLGIDPNQDTSELPTGLATPELSQGCQASGNDASGQFIRTGRGGLTQNPYEPLSSDGIEGDIYPAAQTIAEQTELSQSVATSETPIQNLVEAQELIRTSEGRLMLTVNAPRFSSRHSC